VIGGDVGFPAKLLHSYDVRLYRWPLHKPGEPACRPAIPDDREFERAAILQAIEDQLGSKEEADSLTAKIRNFGLGRQKKA